MMKEKIIARDNFPPNVIENLKKRAAYICSNPKCRVMTIAPSIEDENKVQYIGVAAHITAASIGGPRYDSSLMEEERKSISNAIFLCNNCSSMIDKNNGIDYAVDKLKNWKTIHEKWILDNLNKDKSSTSINIGSTSTNQSGGITANVVNVAGINLNPVDEKKEHDRKIFNNADQIFNEDDLNVIMQSLLCDESIWSNNQDKLEKFKWFFEKSSNEYLDENIEKSKNDLTLSLQSLKSFISNEFDMFPYNQTTSNFKICMQPNLNIDRLGTGKPEEYIMHTELYKKLRTVAHDFEDKFKEYRKVIKLNLFV